MTYLSRVPPVAARQESALPLAALPLAALPLPALSVLGLGYVGSVTAACLAGRGHRVVGVDPQPEKVALINRGEAPILERGIGPLVGRTVADGLLAATADAARAILETDMTLVCVGTPSLADGSLDGSGLLRAAEAIGAALRDKPGFHTVVIRSTVLPGTIEDRVIPALERASGKRAGVGFGIAANPEFMREGSAVADFEHPPKTVIGAADPRSADAVAALYDGIEAPLFRLSIRAAEMLKYADNSWHALKIAFANEIGAACKAFGVRTAEVVDAFLSDTKLNISPAYLRPGFAFGGSCLPKDVRALAAAAGGAGLSLPLVANLLASNEAQLARGVERVLAGGAARVGLLGITFKAGTGDLRESPFLALAERLIARGIDLRVHDPKLDQAIRTGKARDYVEALGAPVAERLASLDAVLDHAECVVIGHGDPAFAEIAGRLRPGQRLLDLYGVAGAEALGERYDGINW